MTHVKWLQRIDALTEPYSGWQQTDAYFIEDVPVTRMRPRALLVPPGIPDFLTRERYADAGRHELTGRAWSGLGAIERVEVSDNGGATWADAQLDEPAGPYAWRGWRIEWDAKPGEHELCCRATDSAGNSQPDKAEWNHGGYCNNAIQRVRVKV
jgi:hypothetical protein